MLIVVCHSVLKLYENRLILIFYENVWLELTVRCPTYFHGNAKWIRRSHSKSPLIQWEFGGGCISRDPSVNVFLRVSSIHATLSSKHSYGETLTLIKRAQMYFKWEFAWEVSKLSILSIISHNQVFDTYISFLYRRKTAFFLHRSSPYPGYLFPSYRY